MITLGMLPEHMVVFERGWLSSNNILFTGPSQTALVDSGYATHADQTVALVEASLGRSPLNLLLNTHLHSDHCGGNAALQGRFCELQTHVPPGEAMAVQGWDQSSLSYAATGQECARFRIDGLLRPGAFIDLGDRKWEIHAAPGHDPHSIVLFEPFSRVLISADALWERGFGVVFPELEGETSFGEVAATLDVIESLAPRLVIPGHGPTFSTVGEALAEARSRLEMFVQDPARHARHALKVLLKFKLLERKRISLLELECWITTTPYFELIRKRFFTSDPLKTLGQEILNALTHSGAAEVKNGFALNR